VESLMPSSQRVMAKQSPVRIQIPRTVDEDRLRNDRPMLWPKAKGTVSQLR
jgi:hypothetical protein